MKEYQFQYTALQSSLLITLSSIAVFVVTELLSIHAGLNEFVTTIVSGGVGFSLFQIFKRKAVHNGIAKLDNASVFFEFENDTKTISFSALTSYKVYYGKNGPVLCLKSTSEKFKLSANNNFCNTDNFKAFCIDIIARLDKYTSSLI